MEKLEKNRKEKIGWLVVAEKSMKKIWDSEPPHAKSVGHLTTTKRNRIA